MDAAKLVTVKTSEPETTRRSNSVEIIRASETERGDDRRNCTQFWGRSRDRSRGESRDKSRGKSRDRSRGKSRDRSRVKSRDRSRGKSRDRSRGESRDRSRCKSRDRSRCKSRDRSRGESRDRSRCKSRDRSRVKSRDRSRGKSRDRSRCKSRNRFLNRQVSGNYDKITRKESNLNNERETYTESSQDNLDSGNVIHDRSSEHTSGNNGGHLHDRIRERSRGKSREYSRGRSRGHSRGKSCCHSRDKYREGSRGKYYRYVQRRSRSSSSSSRSSTSSSTSSGSSRGNSRSRNFICSTISKQKKSGNSKVRVIEQSDKSDYLIFEKRVEGNKHRRHKDLKCYKEKCKGKYKKCHHKLRNRCLHCGSRPRSQSHSRAGVCTNGILGQVMEIQTTTATDVIDLL